MSTPEERLEQALELAELAEEMLRLKPRRTHRDASDADIERMIDEWYLTRPGAEQGDAEGLLVPFPRPKPA